MSRILVADNDLGLAHAIERYLRHEGYAISVVTMHGALSAIDRFCPDLIVVDLPLAKDGVDLCRRIRARTRAPIFVIAPKVAGICDMLDREVSVDDYLIKPLRPHELTNRVEALLRRAPSRTRAQCELICVGELRIDPATRLVSRPERTKLTPKEFELLRLLATHPGQIFSKEQLLYNVWDSGSWADPSTITTHIRRLRQKVERNASNPRYLKTVWGAGYTFQP